MTQKEQIIEYMRIYGSITPMQAFIDLGCTKLATRISEINSDDKYGDIYIRKETVRAINRDGRPVHFMRYSLQEVSA